MKAFIFFVVLEINFQLYAQDIGFETAVGLLKTTKPVKFIATSIELEKDPQKKASLQRTFTQEMDAIGVLQNSHKDVDLDVLFPYIDFTSRSLFAVEDNFRSMPFAREDILRRKAEWPVFALILGMPDAPQLLEGYALNSNNPINYRLDAYQILLYLDNKRLEDVCEHFKREIPENASLSKAEKDKIEAFIDDVQNNRRGAGFEGGVDIKSPFPLCKPPM